MINGTVEWFARWIDSKTKRFLNHLKTAFAGNIVQTARYVIRKIKGMKRKKEREREKKREREEKERTVRTKEVRIYVTVDERATVYI